jgi:hypothetical protein
VLADGLTAELGTLTRALVHKPRARTKKAG